MAGPREHRAAARRPRRARVRSGPGRGPATAAAAGEGGGDRASLAARHPQPVLRLHLDLAGDVGAVERPVRRQPLRRVVVALRLVGRAVDGQQDERVVRVAEALRSRPARRSGSPGVGERNDMVDLDGERGADPAAERDRLAGVGVVQQARGDLAVGARAEGDRTEIPAENVVAGVAAVTVDVRPGGAEAGAGVSRHRRRRTHGQPPQLGNRPRVRDRRGGRARRRGRSGHGAAAAPVGAAADGDGCRVEGRPLVGVRGADEAPPDVGVVVGRAGVVAVARIAVGGARSCAAGGGEHGERECRCDPECCLSSPIRT